MSRLSTGIANDVTTLGDRVVTLNAATITITPQEHAGKLLLMTRASNVMTINLPVASGSGDVYKFLNAAVRTSGSVVINAGAGTPGASGVFVGQVTSHGGAASNISYVTSTNDIFTLNITTTGGVNPGDYLEVVDTAAGIWRVTKAEVWASGLQATPFTTS